MHFLPYYIFIPHSPKLFLLIFLKIIKENNLIIGLSAWSAMTKYQRLADLGTTGMLCGRKGAYTRSILYVNARIDGWAHGWLDG